MWGQREGSTEFLEEPQAALKTWGSLQTWQVLPPACRLCSAAVLSLDHSSSLCQAPGAWSRLHKISKPQFPHL